MQEEKRTSQFSTNLFWDAALGSVDLEKHASYVVSRVFECGTLKDWNILCGYYGIPRIAEICKSLRTMDPKALAFICLMSETRPEEYRCYHFKQSSPTLWNS